MSAIAPPVLACISALLAREGPVSRHDTHISTVLLAGERVFKLKRPVRFPYLDFSTPEKRLAACTAELALNRRTAPSLYRTVHRITQAADGAPVLDGDGPLLDAAVEMRRFPEADLFDAMVQARRLEPVHLEALAERLAAFHAAAEPSQTGGGAAAMARILAMNAAALREARLMPETQTHDLVAHFEAALYRLTPRLEARRAAGKVRRCHGDLTLRNICLFEGVPTPFDCIEFDPDLATIDVLYDLAFLLMDLRHRGRDDFANLLFNRYLDAADEVDGLALLPFFMAARAAIRAHVTVSGAGDRAEARAYCGLAADLLAPAAPCLVAIGGFSGSGKSSLAQALAPALGPAPGARVLSSDRIRKRLCGVGPTTRLPEAAYAPEMSERVYARMEAEAATVLSSGHAVIADAVFDRDKARGRISVLAERQQVPFHGFWLAAPAEALAARIRARRGDPSDATPEVLEAQLRRGAGSPNWHQLDAAGKRQALRAAALALCRSDSSG